MGGRPSKLTEEVMTNILEAIKVGTPKTKAFLCNGISISTGYRWAEGDETFSGLMETAEACYEHNMFKAIYDCATKPLAAGDYKAAVLSLKMRRPEYRDGNKTEVNVNATATASSQAVPNEKLEQIQRLHRSYAMGGNN